MGITIKDIAKLVGVSRGTVDRALHDRGQVAPEIKKKILKVASDYGYKRNLIASRLAKKENVNIAVVLPDPDQDTFWQHHYDGINKLKESFGDFGINIINYKFDLFDSVSYSDAFGKAIMDRPQGILVAPLFLSESHSYLNMASQNKVPVICINSEIQRDHDLFYIGQNSFESGKLAGKLFSFSSTRAKKIIVLTLGLGANNAIHIQRKIDGLASYNYDNDCGFEIVEYSIEDFQNQKSLEKLQREILAMNDEVAGLFFTNSRAYHFLDNTRILDEGESNVTIVGFDLIDENIRLLKENKIQFLLNQSPDQQSYLGLVNFFNHFIHGKEIPKQQYLPTDVVFKENCDLYLKNRFRFLESAI